VAKAQPQTYEAKKEVVSVKEERKEINGAWAVKAFEGESLANLADRLKMPASDLMRFNDIQSDHQPIAGMFYFLEKKKTKGNEQAYTARPGDNLWLISQLQGVQLKRLKKYNGNVEVIASGSVVWLASVKSKAIAEDAIELKDEDTFDWSVKADNHKVQVSTEQQSVTEPRQSISTQIKKKENQSERQEQGVISQLIIHEVKPSDTLFSVAQQYNVTIKELMDWNSKVDFVLAVGEKLKIKPR
jgi:FOG: LysM repeat